jgi:hypothetical protein
MFTHRIYEYIILRVVHKWNINAEDQRIVNTTNKHIVYHKRHLSTENTPNTHPLQQQLALYFLRSVC